MKILIAKANEGIVKSMSPSITFNDETKNTSSFIVSPLKFKTLSQTAKVKGYNPIALFTVI